MKIIPILKRWTPTQSERILAAYWQSSLSQPEFARQYNIGTSTPRIWLRQSASKPPSSAAAFLPIPNLLPQPGVAPAYRLQWPGGLVLELRSGFVPQEVAHLLQLLPTS